MDRDEANALFGEADALFRAGEYGQSLELVGRLEADFPNNHRVLNAKAKALAALGREAEALAVCDLLLAEHGYEKIRPLRDKLAGRTALTVVETAKGGEFSGEAATAEVMEEDVAYETVDIPRASRFRIKPIRLILLVLICVAVWRGFLPWWLGAGLVGAYFGVKWLLRWALFRLFTLPFKMKGRALEGATATIHSVTRAEPAERNREDDEEDEPEPEMPSRWVWIDFTITPPERSRGFTHWEPGELAIAPASLRLKKLDDHDKCSQVADVIFVNNDGDQEDEGYKIVGPQRLRVRAPLPGKATETRFKFVYYFEVFGEFEAPAGV